MERKTISSAPPYTLFEPLVVFVVVVDAVAVVPPAVAVAAVAKVQNEN